MNPHSQNLQELLDDVVPAAGADIGPDRTALMVMVRREHSRRRRARVMFAAVSVAFAAMLLIWQSAPWKSALVPAKPPVSVPIVIHQVDDQQLLVLLKGTPAALMEWPDGQRTLLVMEH
jgi:hypothetical protein